MALLVDYCAACGQRTPHRLDGEPGEAEFSLCKRCGHATPMPPPSDLYQVTFTNMTDPAAEPAAGQYRLRAVIAGDSEAAALDWAIPWALSFNSRGGLPPHGVQVSAEELRRRAVLVHVGRG
jgi:hypothetical protein